MGDVGQAGVDLARASRQVVLFGEGFDGVEAFSDDGLKQLTHLMAEACR